MTDRPSLRRNRRRHRALRHIIGGLAVIAGLAGITVGAVATYSDDPADHIPSSDPSMSAPKARVEPSPRPTARIETLRAGRGVRGAEIVRPAGTTPLPGVIFLHGWGLVARSDYRPWIRHLARAGNQVIVPRYQRNKDSDPGRALRDALAGVRAAVRKAPIAPGTLVVAGHSAGGALAADYAASAAARRLPPALAVFSVYPGRRILGYPLGIPEVDPRRIPTKTRIVAMAGAKDVVVGRAPAQQLVAGARRVPDSRKRYVLVRRDSVAGHYGPTRSTRSARKVFWDRLDRLIARSRTIARLG